MEHRLRGGGAGRCSAGRGACSLLQGEAQKPSPDPQQAPPFSASSGLSSGSPQRRLLYLLLLQSSPWAEASPLECLQTAGSKQMQGLFANCHGPGLLRRPARWVQPCGFQSHLPQADSWVEPLPPLSQSITSWFAFGKIKSNATEEPKQSIGPC